MNSQEEVKDFIHSRSVPLIEKVFTFKPDLREGYIRQSRERRISNRVGLFLYNKRIPIAQDIVDNSHLPPRESIVSALVNNHIAPRSADGWVNYVLYLVGTQGGWDVFCDQLRRDLSYIQVYKEKTKIIYYNTCVITAFVVLLHMIINTMFNYMIPPIVGVGVVLSYVITAHSALITVMRRDRDAWVGREKKSRELHPARIIRQVTVV